MNYQIILPQWIQRKIDFDRLLQTQIIRTKSSLWEMGSDYLFILRGLRILISETVWSSGLNPNQGGRGSRKKRGGSKHEDVTELRVQYGHRLRGIAVF